MFTFSFSTAFAAPLSDAQKDALNVAYSNLSVGAYTSNYDNLYHDRTSAYYTNLPDLTSFVISAAYMQKAVDEAYTYAVVNGVVPGSVDLTHYDATDANRASSVEVAQIKAALLTAAKTTYLSTAAKAAFPEYKEMLKGLVESIDLSAYTSTKQTTPYTAADGEQYYTAAEAAAADVAYLLAVIDKATYATSDFGTPSATAAWKVGYGDLYKAIFEGTVADVKEHKDDTLDTALVTGVTYILKGNYATAKSEAASAANTAVAKATALAKLTQAVTNWENGTNYSSKQDAAIAAYVEAQKYLIENGTVTGSENYTISSADKTKVNGTDYVAISETAAKVNAAQETAKTDAAILGKSYVEADAAKALKARLLAVYAGTSTETSAPYTGASALTAGAKAAAKIDLSDVEAQGTIAEYYAYNAKNYYAKEWEAVKAAVAAYNAAVDAAVVQADVDDAATALNKAVLKIADKVTVDVAVSTSTTNTTLTQLGNYFTLTKSIYNSANSNSEDIFVDFGAGWTNSVVNADVVEWFIDNGARKATEAAALYKDATAVIDAYKSLTVAKADAVTVKAQIAGIPATVTLADKAAVEAAYDAYKELPAAVQIYVTNDAALKSAISKVYGLERNTVVAAVNTLPATTKVTTANKDAVKAVLDTYEVYADTDMYKDNTFTGITMYTTDLSAYENAVKQADLAAINAMYSPLLTKYSVDKLTVEDAEAVAALETAIAAYIADYAASPSTAVESNTKLMAAVVADLVAAEAATEKAEQIAAVEGIKIKANSSAKKGSITVKWTVDEEVEGVKYQVYKSTKAQKGYKKSITTSKTTFKNTKNLKKGTRYYYKVRAIAEIDGVTYYSDWSNKANRIAK